MRFSSISWRVPRRARGGTARPRRLTSSIIAHSSPRLDAAAPSTRGRRARGSLPSSSSPSESANRRAGSIVTTTPSARAGQARRERRRRRGLADAAGTGAHDDPRALRATGQLTSTRSTQRRSYWRRRSRQFHPLLTRRQRLSPRAARDSLPSFPTLRSRGASQREHLQVEPRARGAPRHARFALAVAVLAFGYSVAQSQSGSTPPYPAAEKHKPSTLADRIVLTYEGDPGTTQNVSWRTDSRSSPRRCSSRPRPTARLTATTTTCGVAPTEFATARLHDQVPHGHSHRSQPNTSYVYRVGDGDELERVVRVRDRIRRRRTVLLPRTRATRRTTSSPTPPAPSAPPSRRGRTPRPSCTPATSSTPTISDAEWGEWFSAAG